MQGELSRRDVTEALAALGELLAARGLRYELVLVGGAALLLRGIVARSTKDADILGTRVASGHVVKLDRMPAPLADAIADVARTYDLPDDWVNLGPASLLDLGLPDGFEDRLDRFDAPGLDRRDDTGLVVWLAGRYDLVCFKLYAVVDRWPARDRHIEDLSALSPTEDELLDAAAWARTHDPSPGFRAQLVTVLRHLGVEDADARLDQ